MIFFILFSCIFMETNINVKRIPFLSHQLVHPVCRSFLRSILRMNWSYEQYFDFTDEHKMGSHQQILYVCVNLLIEVNVDLVWETIIH